MGLPCNRKVTSAFTGDRASMAAASVTRNCSSVASGLSAPLRHAGVAAGAHLGLRQPHEPGLLARQIEVVERAAWYRVRNGFPDLLLSPPTYVRKLSPRRTA